jgi:hypothetical protein
MGARVTGHPQVRRLLHSPLRVYYRVDDARSAIVAIAETIQRISEGAS